MSAVLDFLIGLPKPLPIDASEADARALIIDPLLAHVGWGHGDIRREPYAGWDDSRGFIDFLLFQNGKPTMVVEAKKTGRSFSLPNNLTSQRITSFRKIRATASQNLKEALDQALRYTQHTGAPYACVTNGDDWIFFKPAHNFRSLPEARVVIFNGIEQVIRRIDDFLDLVSYEGVQQGRAEKSLLGRELQKPLFARRLSDAFPYHDDPTLEEEDYSVLLDQLLRHFIDELTDEPDFKECYVPVRPNRTTAKSLDELIAGRVEAFKSAATKADIGTSVLAKPLMPSQPSGRTVVLHGEVGVGKTSFLRHVESELRADGKLNHAVWSRVDLLPFQDRPFSLDERSAMLSLICKSIQEQVVASAEQLGGNYDPDIWAHLRDIYNTEVRAFQKARYPESNDSDQVFMDEARRYVWNLKQDDPQDHLIRVIRWLTVNCKLPVVVALDNSDQLGLEFQEFLYKLAEKLKSSTSAVVILVMRTEALASHVIREHSIASVREQYLIEKAPLAAVLKRRFDRILRQLPQAEPGSAEKAARDRIVVLIETIAYEAEIGSDAFRLVQAAGNGSLRDNLRAISAIFRSSPRAMDRLVVAQHESGKARLTVAQTLRAVMKDDLSSVDGNKLLPNIFNVDSQVVMPYSIGIRILQQVLSKSSSVQYTVAALLNDFAIAGVDRVIVERVLHRLRTESFVSVSHMLAELRAYDVPRVSRLGLVLLEIVLNEMSYVSRMALETYIYDKSVYQDMRSAWTSGPGEFGKKFAAIGRLFSGMVVEDDELLRQRLDISNLEPVVNSVLPGVLAR